MSKAEQINGIHEDLNDVFSELHNIPVRDQQGREARQNAFFALISLRKRLDHMGMRHTRPQGKNHAQRWQACRLGQPAEPVECRRVDRCQSRPDAGHRNMQAAVADPLSVHNGAVGSRSKDTQSKP